MPDPSDQVRRVFNGLISVAVLVAIIVFAKMAVDRWRAGDVKRLKATPETSSSSKLDPEVVRSFYDSAIKRIEDECSPSDKRCETRVKEQTAVALGIPEGQAETVFFGEGLRRGRQGR